MTFTEALGKGAGQMGLLLLGVTVFHFWGWYGLAGEVVFTTIAGLIVVAAKGDLGRGSAMVDRVAGHHASQRAAAPYPPPPRKPVRRDI